MLYPLDLVIFLYIFIFPGYYDIFITKFYRQTGVFGGHASGGAPAIENKDLFLICRQNGFLLLF